MSQLRIRLTVSLVSAFALAIAVLGVAYGGSYAHFALGVGLGAVIMLLAVVVASRRPKWTGWIPGLLGGMIAAAMGSGWRQLPSWGAFIGAAATILAWVVIDRESPTEPAVTPHG